MPILDAAVRRYAKALLDVAGERSLADRIATDLRSFLAQVQRSPDLAATVASPTVPRDTLARAVTALATSMGLSDLARSYLGILAQRRRLGQLGAILEAYATEVDQRAGRARGELVTAGPIAPGQMLRVRDAIGKVLGRQLVLSQKVDPTLLGGLKVSIGDKVFDLSVRTYLESLRAHLLERR